MSNFKSVPIKVGRAQAKYLRGDAPVSTTRQIFFILREHFSMSALTAAMDAVMTTNMIVEAPFFKIVLAAHEKIIKSDLAILLSTEVTLADMNIQSSDIVIVCGGFQVKLDSDYTLIRKLREADRLGCALGGIWNGAFFLADAGVLDEYECAFHPDARATIKERFPMLRVTRYSHVLDRHRATCASATSALEMMLNLLETYTGWTARRSVEKRLLCDHGNGIAGTSACLRNVPLSLPSALRVALELMHSNIEDPILVSEISRHAGISRRQLERLFLRYMEATPRSYYMRLRLTHARQLLQHTDKPMSQVALASGFVSFPHFSKRFREMFAIAPTGFRARDQGRLDTKATMSQ